MKSINHIYINNKKLFNFLDLNNYFKNQEILVQIFTLNKDKYFIKSLINLLTENIKGVKIIGATTDGTISKNKVSLDDTVLTFSIFKKTKVVTYLQKLKNKDSYTLGEEISQKSIVKNSNQKLAICFTDGLQTNSEEFLNGFKKYSNGITLIGGRAGDNGEFKKTLIFNEKTISDSGAVLAILSSEDLVVNTVYNFGWEEIGREFIITKSIQNRVYTIDNQPAVEIYKKYLGEDILKSSPTLRIEFPFILKRDGMTVARASSKIHEDGSVSYTGSINTNERVQFGYGNTLSISNNQKNNIEKILKYPVESIFIYSCMSRRRLLLNDTNKEIRPYSKISNVSGFFGYGEYYTDNNKNYHLLNETKVVLTLSESNNIQKKKRIKSIQKNKNQIATLNALSNLISRTTEEYMDLNKNLELKISLESAKIRAILDSNPSIITMFEKGSIKDANLAFFRFFNEISSIEEFNLKYDLLDKLFYNYNDFDPESYIKSTFINGIYWLEFIVQNPKIKYKVAVKKDDKIYHFMINVKKIENIEDSYIVEFIDLTSYISFQKEISKKDQMLLQQSKLAQMGEMIGMIAHQWRQPLTAISSVSNTLLIKNELDSLDKETIKLKLENINKYTQHLSSTIDDFRSFFKPDKESHETTFYEIVTSIENIIRDSLIHNNIKLNIQIQNAEDKFNTFPNELKQVVLNIIKNAKDAIIDNKIKNGFIDISNFNDIEYKVLKITDNGGGIDESIQNKIFEQYFTTKEKLDGTGIGLYMSKVIVNEHLDGDLKFIPEDNGSTFLIRIKNLK